MMNMELPGLRRKRGRPQGRVKHMCRLNLTEKDARDSVR